MSERKPISKKLRFEVFKRDSFTCQYCGKMAPDTILEIDHIDPVKDGGKNNIINLQTSCFDCNRGKGCKPLSDNQVIKQQQEQLKEINERREQLKLLLQWKKELERFDSEQVDAINEIIISVSNKKLSEIGRQVMLKTIRKYGISNVIDATNASIQQYLKEDDNNVSKVIDYIPRICAMKNKQKDNPYLYKSYYIKGIIRNRFGLRNEKRLIIALTNVVCDEESYNVVENIAKSVESLVDFWDLLNEYFETDY